jgi:N-acetyl sugar amidotransferase
MTPLAPYCRKCWFPSSKPNFELSADRICRACARENERATADPELWRQREKVFSQLIEEAVAVGAPNFDVVVPVSGGKDSITQVVRASQHGARVLAICVDYGVKTEIGRQNLDAVPAVAPRVHLQTYRPPLGLHRALILKGLENYGDPDLFSHTLLHAYPLHQAIALQVPLVVLGENSAAQYGGATDLANLPGMTREWFESYAVSGRHSVTTTATELGFDPNELRYYDFPDSLGGSATKTVFMSAFFPWDSETHLRIAIDHGFKVLSEAREGTFRNYVGIDEHINRLHQYLKFLKFGYGRTTDHACEEIRMGRMDRETARQVILDHELSPPSVEAMNQVAAFLQISVTRLAELMEKFRSPEIWEPSRPNHFALPGFLELERLTEVEALTSLYNS